MTDILNGELGFKRKAQLCDILKGALHQESDVIDMHEQKIYQSNALHFMRFRGIQSAMWTLNREIVQHKISGGLGGGINIGSFSWSFSKKIQIVNGRHRAVFVFICRSLRPFILTRCFVS